MVQFYTTYFFQWPLAFDINLYPVPTLGIEHSVVPHVKRNNERMPRVLPWSPG